MSSILCPWRNGTPCKADQAGGLGQLRLQETEAPVRVDVRSEAPGDEAAEAGTYCPIRKIVALL